MKMSDFGYKKHSLEQVKTWVRDALVSAEVSPQEIYDTIKGVVDEEYHYFKHHTGRCYDLLCLLNGNGRGHIEGWDAWEKTYYPEESQRSCDKNDTSEECKKSWTSFWEETGDGMRPWGHSDLEYLVANQKKDKVKKWVLPVEEVRDEDTDKDECCITFPEDLLEAADLKENDRVEWVDQGDGSYLIKKVN
jgi:hypothetical protein